MRRAAVLVLSLAACGGGDVADAEACKGGCPDGSVCLETGCAELCTTDADCPIALSCVTGACLSVNHDCDESSDCKPSSPCLTSTCFSGLCHEAIGWPRDTVAPQPQCPFEGEDTDADNVLDDGEVWGGVCDHAGECVGCTEDSQCAGADACTLYWCDQGICLFDDSVLCTCDDGQENREETDVDCGGDTCLPCSALDDCITDDDCLGLVCELGQCADVVCMPGDTLGCGSDVGECVAGHEDCVRGQWSACLGDVGPEPEVCDAKDNDCDGVVDMGCPCMPGTWMAEVIDTFNDSGAYASSAVGPDGSVHAAYWYNNANDLRYAVHPPEGFWEMRVVDSAADVGSHSSIAVDSQGGAHIVYYDNSSDSLKYAYRAAGGAFATNVIDAYGNVGQYASIALDPSGGVHVAYYDGSNLDLKYAYKLGALPWQTQTLDSTNNVGQHTSIAVDRQGDVHLAYYYATSGDLRYLHKPAGGSFEAMEPVDSTNDVGEYSSIAVDSSDTPHIVYHDTTGLLRHAARKPTGGWDLESIDGVLVPYNVGQFASLAIDDADTLHVSYRQFTNDDLKYAWKPWGGAWTVTTVDGDTPATDVGQYTSLAVDDFGDVHIAYYDVGNANLKYAYLPAGSSTWVTSVLDNFISVGTYASLDVDPRGGVHVSYYDATNYTGGDVDIVKLDLRYAYRKRGGPWSASTADASTVGQHASIAVDRLGGAHLAYYDSSNTSLWYVFRNPNGDFDPPYEVDNSASVGQYASIAVGDDDVVRIAYYDATADNLKYAERSAAGVWSTLTADPSTNVVGLYAAVGVDAGGNVHVAYYDSSTDDLKYAYKPAGGVFIPSTVDQANDRGQFVDLAVEPSGVVHVCYYDATELKLLYGRRSTQGLWTLLDVDDTYADDGGRAGQYCSIAVTADGRARIAYSKELNTYLTSYRWGLRYAEQQPDDSFELHDLDTRVITNVGNVGSGTGLYTDIAITKSGATSIVYYDSEANDLQHMYRCPE